MDPHLKSTKESPLKDSIIEPVKDIVGISQKEKCVINENTYIIKYNPRTNNKEIKNVYGYVRHSPEFEGSFVLDIDDQIRMILNGCSISNYNLVSIHVDSNRDAGSIDMWSINEI